MSKVFYKAWMDQFDKLSASGNASNRAGDRLLQSFHTTAILMNMTPSRYALDVIKFDWQSYLAQVQEKYNFRPLQYKCNEVGDVKVATLIDDDKIIVAAVGDEEENPSVSLSGDTLSPELAKELLLFAQQFVIEEKNLKTVHLVVSDHDCISTMPIDSFKVDPLIRENYALNVQQGFDHMVQQLTKDNPNGRLHLLEGEPGTGKSRFITALIKDVTAKFLFIPVMEAHSLTSPAFMGFLAGESEDLNGKPLILILEDSEALLQKRSKVSSGEAAMVSSILNLVDSPIAQGLNLHIISTFNAKIQDFDTAITRPGRLATHIIFPKLSFMEANVVLRRELEATGQAEGEHWYQFKEEKSYSLAEIYKEVNKASADFHPDNKVQPGFFGAYN